MLKTININNFKSVHDLEIELGKINVFIGENGCGKTSILEAIGLASAAISSKLDQEFLVSRGIRVTEPRLMKSAFQISEKENNIGIKLTNTDNDFVNYQINYKNKSYVIDKFETNLKPSLSDAKFSEFFNILASDNDLLSQLTKGYEKKTTKQGKTAKEGKVAKEKSKQLYERFIDLVTKHYSDNQDPFIRTDFINSHNDQFEKKFNFANFLIYTPENYFLRRFEEDGQIRPIGVRGEGLFSHLVELFKTDEVFYNELCINLKLINWFDGIEIPSDLAFTEMRLNIKDRFLKDNIEYFDQRSANEGFLYLLFYFTLFLSKDTPDFFAIDNIDNALNPKLCRELVERIVLLSKKSNKQVILTTHNPSILDGLDLTDDDQRLFVVFRNADGHTKTRRIKPPKNIEGIDTIRLSEAFIRGYIGGLPKNF